MWNSKITDKGFVQTGDLINFKFTVNYSNGKETFTRDFVLGNPVDDDYMQEVTDGEVDRLNALQSFSDTLQIDK